MAFIEDERNMPFVANFFSMFKINKLGTIKDYQTLMNIYSLPKNAFLTPSRKGVTPESADLRIQISYL